MTKDQLKRFLDKYFAILKLTSNKRFETARETEKLDKLEAIIRKGKAEHDTAPSPDHPDVLQQDLPSLPVGSSAEVDLA